MRKYNKSFVEEMNKSLDRNGFSENILKYTLGMTIFMLGYIIGILSQCIFWWKNE